MYALCFVGVTALLLFSQRLYSKQGRYTLFVIFGVVAILLSIVSVIIVGFTNDYYLRVFSLKLILLFFCIIQSGYLAG
jgi:hypothetical protein